MKYCIVPLPLESRRAPRRAPRISDQAIERALWFYIGFYSALTIAGFAAGILQ